MALGNSKILKVAGFSFVGFCVVSLGVERTSIGPAASQLAGFFGAFLGGWIANKRKGSAQAGLGKEAPEPAPPESSEAALPDVRVTREGS